MSGWSAHVVTANGLARQARPPGDASSAAFMPPDGYSAPWPVIRLGAWRQGQ